MSNFVTHAYTMPVSLVLWVIKLFTCWTLYTSVMVCTEYKTAAMFLRC